MWIMEHGAIVVESNLWVIIYNCCCSCYVCSMFVVILSFVIKGVYLNVIWK